jgi:hypothetical protein
MISKLLALLICSLVTVFCRAQVASRFDIVITELMPDPSPIVGLPNAEYIELKNTSSTGFNLLGWKISDGAGTATIGTSFILQPDSMVIICSNGSLPLFLPFGRAIGVASFPSLNNDGDLISLLSPQAKNIHAVEYNKSWYGNAVKSAGGWSLEMIDSKNPCAGQNNWTASIHTTGGTPGKKNSVDGLNTDSTPPQLKRSFATDSVTIVLVFDEPLDSASAAARGNYSIENGPLVNAVKPLAPLFNTVQLKLATALAAGTVYSITATSLTDCRGNAIGGFNKVKTGLAQDAASADVVINEILFNPKPGGYDYVELYNRSSKITDVAKLYIANRGTNGTIASPKKASETTFYFFPGEYIVLTEDAVSLDQTFFVKSKDAVFTLSSLPPFPDNEGTVVITNFQGSVVDEVHYKDDWHFGLIANADGVALERLDPAGASQDRNNWHSAASTAGYGTPGYQNSQFKQGVTAGATVEIVPKVFSPDNDGMDDIATIYYSISEAGYVANVIIFDASGTQIRHLVKNALPGLKGFWTWDGLGEKRERLPVGTYIIYTELFNLKGKKERFKNTVVLARKLN